MRPVEPQVEPCSESIAAGARTVSRVVPESAESDNETDEQCNCDADTEGDSDEEMAVEPEPEEPQVEPEPEKPQVEPEPEKSKVESDQESGEMEPEEPVEPEPEEVEPQGQEELEPQLSPVQESSHSDSYESDSTASTGVSSVNEYDSGNDSYTSVDHFDSDEEEVNPNNEYRKISMLHQTIKLDGHDVNILYDEGVNMSTMSAKVAAPPLLKAVNSCGDVAVGGEGVGIETCPLVEIPLPLYDGGVGMAQVRVTNRE
jgi:hypothetical protein